MAHSYAELSNTPDNDLIAEHDKLARNTCPGVSYYLDELRRRENDTLCREMHSLNVQIASMTRRIEVLTWIAAICAVISVVVTLFMLWK